MDKPATPGPRKPPPIGAPRARRQRAGFDPALRLTLARAAVAYCLVAVVACLVLGAGAVLQQTAAARQVRLQQAAVLAVKPQADAAEASYRELSAQQETERMRYSGPQAMEMSLKVQAAKQQAETLGTQEKSAQAGLDTARAALRAAGLRFVPLVAVLLVHAVLLGLVAVANPGLARRLGR
jgi:hypothetical protein